MNSTPSSRWVLIPFMLAHVRHELTRAEGQRFCKPKQACVAKKTQKVKRIAGCAECCGFKFLPDLFKITDKHLPCFVCWTVGVWIQADTWLRRKRWGTCACRIGAVNVRCCVISWTFMARLVFASFLTDYDALHLEAVMRIQGPCWYVAQLAAKNLIDLHFLTCSTGCFPDGYVEFIQ